MEKNNDTLITFGEEAYTMRKDDPRTKEAIERSKELKDDKIKEWIQSGEVSMFEGLNMNNARGEDEDFQDTLRLIKKIKFINSYSFIFSARPGTVAADLNLVDTLLQSKNKQDQATAELAEGGPDYSKVDYSDALIF